jgi:hypothetical protein
VLGFLGLTTVDVSQEFLFAHVSELVHGLGFLSIIHTLFT